MAKGARPGSNAPCSISEQGAVGRGVIMGEGGRPATGSGRRTQVEGAMSGEWPQSLSRSVNPASLSEAALQQEYVALTRWVIAHTPQASGVPRSAEMAGALSLIFTDSAAGLRRQFMTATWLIRIGIS